MRLNVYFVVIDGIMWFAMDKPSNEGLLLQCIGELNSTWTHYYLFRNVVCLQPGPKKYYCNLLPETR